MVNNFRRLFFPFIVCFICWSLPGFSQEAIPDEKTVLLAILAKNKAHVLKRYLKCIDELDYNKKLITVYINTNNNQDNTAEILTEWAKENRSKYKKIIFKQHHIKRYQETYPHEWTSERFKVLAKLRQTSLLKTKEYGCNYYFVVDCDNFIAPCTLKELISKKKPIIAPMLTAIPEANDTYSNFFCAITENGYYEESPVYFNYLSRKITGTFCVPVVHCTYLIDASTIDHLNYLDGTDDYEFVIFSREARKNNINQFICNEKHFGYVLHFYDSPSLTEEVERVKSMESSLTY